MFDFKSSRNKYFTGQKCYTSDTMLVGVVSQNAHFEFSILPGVATNARIDSVMCQVHKISIYLIAWAGQAMGIRMHRHVLQAFP